MIWQGKKVLVTGADGFIGSHLTETLARAGADVRALCVYNSAGSYGWLDESPAARDCEIVLGDVRDAHCCQALTKGVDTVFNLAALIAIPYSYAAPQSYVDTNVSGALNLCLAAREAGVRRFVQTSTSEVYGTARYVPIDEKHPKQPQSPYSASKIGADALALSFWHAFELPVTVARPFNTYGPRQSARAIIPTVIAQIAQGAEELRLGALTPTRDFNYVQDTCDGFLALAACDEAVGLEVNIGSGAEHSIGDTVALIQRLMGSSLPVRCEERRLRPEGSEVNRLLCDSSLLHSLTGFRHRYSLEDGLRPTIDWFRDSANLRRYKGDKYNV